MAWEHADGHRSPVRCESPNRCDYCSWLTSLENATVVRLDAEHCLPELGFTLTTKRAFTPREVFTIDVRQTIKALRREPWARDARYLGMVEHTTGTGASVTRPNESHAAPYA